MIVKLSRPQGDLIIIPDNVVNITKSSFEKELVWGVVMSSGDIVYINEDEMLLLEDALGLRDKQIQNLIDNTETIINNLEQLNVTSSSIDDHSANIETTSSAIKSTTGEIKTITNNIYTQTKSNGTLLTNIKSVCDGILSWVKSHYPYSN